MTDAERDARIATLEASVADLRDEVVRLSRPQRRSMKVTGRCPDCGARNLLQFRQSRQLRRMPWAYALYKFSTWRGLSMKGLLETFACRECLLVEWRATTLDDVVPNGDEVIAHEQPLQLEPETGPYR